MKCRFTIGSVIISQRNASWLDESESPTTVVHRSRLVAKSFFSIFFKSSSPVLIHCVDEGITRDQNYSIENCHNPVVKEIWKQRRSVGTKDIKWLEDNTRPHVQKKVSI